MTDLSNGVWNPADRTREEDYEDLAKRIADKLVPLIDYKLKRAEPMGNIIRVPDIFKEYIVGQSAQYGSTNETYYVTPVGYGPFPMSIHFIFRKDTFSMEFRSTDGTRMMVLEFE